MGSKAEDTDQHFLRSLRKNIQFWRKNKTTSSNLVKAFAQKTQITAIRSQDIFCFFVKSSLPTNSPSTVILEAVGCTNEWIKSNSHTGSPFLHVKISLLCFLNITYNIVCIST